MCFPILQSAVMRGRGSGREGRGEQQKREICLRAREQRWLGGGGPASEPRKENTSLCARTPWDSGTKGIGYKELRSWRAASLPCLPGTNEGERERGEKRRRREEMGGRILS